MDYSTITIQQADVIKDKLWPGLISGSFCYHILIYSKEHWVINRQPGDSAASLGPIKRLFFGLSLDPNKSKRKSVGPWISMEHRVMTKWHETPEKNEIEENCPGRKIIFI